MDASYQPTTSGQAVHIGNGVATVKAADSLGLGGANIAAMTVPHVGTSDHKVVHDYHDHANDPDGDYNVHHIVQKTAGASGVEQSFPMKLHYMLNDIEQDGLAHIVSWQPHGRCFVVHNQRLFVEKILGCWFRQSKIASFQRQLNIYGFQRLTTGPDKGGYYHELFLRTKPGLASRILRQKLKGTKTRRAASPESEPNFYAMPPLPSNTKPSVYAGAAAPVTAATSASSVPSCQPNSFPALQSTNNESLSDSLSLQKMAPSLFSPAAFETTVHHLVPQQQQQQSRQPRGLTVTSTCSVTVKPTDNYDEMGRLGSNANPLGFPLRSALLSANAPQYTNANALASAPATNTETLWAALCSGSSAVPVATTKAPPPRRGGENGNSPGTSLWLLR